MCHGRPALSFDNPSHLLRGSIHRLISISILGSTEYTHDVLFSDDSDHRKGPDSLLTSLSVIASGTYLVVAGCCADEVQIQHNCRGHDREWVLLYFAQPQ